MAFDGITIAAMVQELHKNLDNGRFNKIAQPEADALMITGKGANGQCRLFISASPSLPLIYFTGKNKPSPLTAPNFCMLLRKHLGSARIGNIVQPGLERVVEFELEHLNELGDPCKKYLIVELMGKYSNIIFCDENERIIDSIKRVPSQMSSVREVLPGREYFIPETQDKRNPLDCSYEQFCEKASSLPLPLAKALTSAFTGISGQVAAEICYRASLDADIPINTLEEDALLHLYHNFSWLMEDVENANFKPCILYKGEEPAEYAAILPTRYEHTEGYHIEPADSISAVLEQFYASRSLYTRMRQKSVDLRKIVSTHLERSSKKLDLQLKQLKDTEKRDKYKVYGELLNTYGYQVTEGAKSVEVPNYYTGEMLTIPLDETLSPLDNAKKYFARYNKLKRTFEALNTQTEETKTEIAHLQTIQAALAIAESEDDLAQIRDELETYGYIRRKMNGKKKQKFKSKPFHYRSSDGFDIYVGKNNFQNDELTFKVANGNDWWFHAKGMPGSHVIVKTEGRELPDRTFEEAGRLAGYYSSGRDNEKIEIDYLQRKNVKKPNGAVAGYVIYYTNYSLTIHPDISGIEKISE